MNPARITIHCSDSPNGNYVSVDTIRDWHLKRGFKDIGYHYIIQPLGKICSGRPIQETGAHVEGDNEDNVGICLIGRTKFSVEQFESLKRFIKHICKDYNIPLYMIHCHNDFDSAKKQGKKCPNFRIQDFMKFYLDDDWDAIKESVIR